MKKYSRGQSLFEVVLALALATLIIVALISLVSNSIKNSSYSRNKTYATRYTQEAFEWLRGERDGDWEIFRDNFLFCPAPPHVRCLDALAWGDCGSCGDTEFIGNIFKREVSFTETATDSVTVEVRTYWTDAQGVHEARSSTILTDWRTLF
jgi:hypothetical protein